MLSGISNKCRIEFHKYVWERNLSLLFSPRVYTLTTIVACIEVYRRNKDILEFTCPDSGLINHY